MNYNIIAIVIITITNVNEIFCYMVKVYGSLNDAYGCLSIAQYDEARKDLFHALGLAEDSRTSFSNYLKEKTPLKFWQISNCKAVFAKYGINWSLRY